jgi:hypothetical protein
MAKPSPTKPDHDRDPSSDDDGRQLPAARLADPSRKAYAFARRLDADSARLRETCDRRGTLAARHKTFAMSSPTSLVEAVIELGHRRIDAIRYKGPGRDEPGEIVDRA